MVGGLSGLTFCVSSDMFSNGHYSRYMYGGPSGPRARTVRVCVELVLFAHNSWNLVGAINRRVAHVRELSWPFLAHIELICDPPTHSLTHIA